MRKGIVTRNDQVWQGHPDVAYFKENFYVVFRESKQHRATEDTKIMLAKSRNGIRYSAPICISKSINRYNCPRLSVIDGSLWISCDLIKQSQDFIGSEQKEENTRIILWCSKNGTDWSYPIETNITGIVPDRICQTDDGGFLIATHILKKNITIETLEDGTKKPTLTNGHLIQNVWKTTKHPLLPQWEKHLMADVSGFNFCEASICNVNGELIALMRENSQRGEPCFWLSSKDHGETWSPPVKTRMFGGHRPVLGKLSSGKFLTTYREQICSHKPPFWSKNTFACLTWPKSMLNPTNPCMRSIILPIEHDNSTRSDSGYTGWMETEDNQIYVVNYVTKDAIRPYITWCMIDEKEF